LLEKLLLTRHNAALSTESQAPLCSLKAS